MDEIYAAACWFATPEEEQFAKQQIRQVLAECGTHLILSPIRWETRHPEDGNCPEPEENAVRETRLLVGEATVLAHLKPKEVKRFVDSLSPSDLKQIRQITRDAYQLHQGGLLTDSECDTMIEYAGPEALAKTLH